MAIKNWRFKCEATFGLTLVVSYPGEVLRLMLHAISNLVQFKLRRLNHTEAFRWSLIFKQIMKGLQERNNSKIIEAQGLDRFVQNDGVHACKHGT